MSHQCQRIGHGGASALAPANTLASFDAALELGVDMVEFDVRGWRGELSVGGRCSRWSRRLGDWRAHVLGGLNRRRWDAIMAQHRLVDECLVSDVVGGGGRLYAWTVNDRSSIDQLRLLGVHGIVTSDPRLFT